MTNIKYNIMNWFAFCLMAAVGYGLADFFVRLTRDKINPVAGAVIYDITAVSILVLTLIIYKFFSKEELIISKQGIMFSVLAGFFLVLGQLGYFFMFLKGGQLSIGVTIAVIIELLLVFLLGITILGETINLLKVTGIILAIISIYLLARS